MLTLGHIPDRLKTAAQALLYTLGGTVAFLVISAVSTGTWPAPTLLWVGVVIFTWVILLAVVWFHLRDFDEVWVARISGGVAAGIAVWSGWLLFSQASLEYLPTTGFFAVIAVVILWSESHGDTA